MSAQAAQGDGGGLHQPEAGGRRIQGLEAEIGRFAFRPKTLPFQNAPGIVGQTWPDALDGLKRLALPFFLIHAPRMVLALKTPWHPLSARLRAILASLDQPKAPSLTPGALGRPPWMVGQGLDG